MSMDFEESSGQRAEFPAHADYTTKAYISFWVNAESNPGAHQAIFVSKTRQGFDRPNFSLLWTPAGGGDVYIVVYAGGVFNEWKADYSPTTGTWENWQFLLDWTTNPDSHRFFVDNVEKTLSLNFNSNNVTPDITATQVISLGGPGAGDPNYTDGKLAEIGIWDRHRTDEERALLARGYSPDHFIDGLKEYIDGRNAFRNLRGGETGTLTNAPVISTDHPPKMVYPSPFNNFRLPKADSGISVAR